MNIPYYDNPGGSLGVSVKLSYASDVFLVDQANYNAYVSGGSFTYSGGHYTQSPVRINVSGAGRFYLIVNDDSGSGYQYSWIK